MGMSKNENDAAALLAQEVIYALPSQAKWEKYSACIPSWLVTNYPT